MSPRQSSRTEKAMKVKEQKTEFSSVVEMLNDGKEVRTTLKPLDLVASRMEAKWGCGRLPRLVSPAMAAKFASAQAKLDDAIRSRDLDDLAHRAEVMIRGWKALDAAAEEAGHESMPKETWSVRHDGREYTIVLDRADVDKVARMSMAPERVVTVNELLLAWKDWRATHFVEKVKQTFPGSEAQAPKKEAAELNDDIPF